MSKLVVSFGEIMLRLAPPRMERFFQSPELLATFGGGEANVAVAVAGFGLPARYVTVLPAKHPAAEACIRELRGLGVDTSHIVRGEGRMGVYYVESGANQRPSAWVTYDRNDSAIALAKPGAINWEKAFEGAGWFHITGIPPAIQRIVGRAGDGGRRGGEEAPQADGKLRFELSEEFVEVGQEGARGDAGAVQNLSTSGLRMRRTCSSRWGFMANPDVESGHLDRGAYEKLAATVLEKFPQLRIIAITLRESKSASHNNWSACLHDRKHFHLSRYYEITHIVDRVGAESSFGGGLIYGLQTLGIAPGGAGVCGGGVLPETLDPGRLLPVDARRGWRI